MKRIAITLITSIILFFSFNPFQISVQATTPPLPISFDEADCMVSLSDNIIVGQDVICGYLTVPEQHNNLDGPTIRLAVMIIKTDHPNPAPDPLVMAQGGPGGSTIDTYSFLLLNNNPLIDNRDVILLEQRGTLYSEPNLICSENITFIAENIERDMTDEEEIQLALETDLACRDRLVAEEINLSAFNSLENAADVEALRQALDYEKINLYGVSYGSLLALHVMRDYPDGLRSVILDGVVPTQINFATQSLQSFAKSLDMLFEACATDPECNSTYPNLEQVFFDLVTEWDEEPTIVPIVDIETLQTYEAVYDGTALINSLFQYLYSTELIPALPKIIYDIKAGDYTYLTILDSFIIFDRTFSGGMYNSVLCAEESDFIDQDTFVTDSQLKLENTTQTDIHPRLIAYNQYIGSVIPAMCQQWAVPAIDEEATLAVNSDIPTLLLSGQFDPITPPIFGELASETLNHSYHYIFPSQGHGAALSGDCPNSIIATFLNNPTVAPDTACIQNQLQPTFYTPSTIVMSDLVSRWLILAFRQQILALALPFLFSIVCLITMLSAWIVWPVGYFFRLIEKQPAPTRPPLAKVARWLIILAGLISIVFIIGIMVVTGANFSFTDMLLFFGFPRSAFPLFVLPPLLFILSGGIIILTIVAWYKKYWSLWRRFYYTLLALATVGHVAVFHHWGLITTLF